VDDCNQLDVDEIEKHYGVYGDPINRPLGQTSAGHSSDEGDWVDMDAATLAAHMEVDEAEAEINSNIHHEPVQVPDCQFPFASNDQDAIFDEALAHFQETQFLPQGYGAQDAEYNTGIYPIVQVIPSGR